VNGIHDMGGMHGMGPIQPEKNELVFHAAWEGRAFALSMAVDGDWPYGADRYATEVIPPEEYLRQSYYEKWITSLVDLMLKSGMVTAAEIETGRAIEPNTKKGHALTAAEVPPMIATGGPASRNVPAVAHFRVGQRVAVADLHQRQLRWAGTVIATAVGVSLVAGQRRGWLLRSCGAMCLLLPHLIGPPAAIGQNSVPTELVHRFSIASVATSAMFWLLVGTLGGLIYSRNQADPNALPTV
jgi:hypothetical protein